MPMPSLPSPRRRLSPGNVKHRPSLPDTCSGSTPIPIWLRPLSERSAGSKPKDLFSETADLKNALMGPYAAIGDPFFWGSLRPFSGIAAVCLAVKGFILAPLLFLILYNPVHLWVRVRGFITGWQQGKNAVEFIRRLELPSMSRRIRWCSTILLGCAAYLASAAGVSQELFQPGLPGQIGGLLVVLASFLAVRKGLSPLAILYGSVTLFAVVMMMR